MKDQKTITVLLIILILAGIFFLAFKSELTGQAVRDQYSYTKAICNETNFCQDYEITCRNKEVVSVVPITGATIQQSENWQEQVLVPSLPCI